MQTVGARESCTPYDGGVISGSTTLKVWSNETLELSTPTRTKHTFTGWTTEPGQTQTYTGAQIMALLKTSSRTEITLYAVYISWDDVPEVTVPSVPEFPSTGEEVYSLRSTESTETTENAYTKTYTYDLSGNRTSFVLTKDGATVHNITYEYDELHRLYKVRENGNHRATYTYDANGNRVSLKYASGTLTTYTYNKANWVTGLTSVDSGTTLVDYAYTYYASGNQKSETDKDGVVTSYTYDGLGRLTQESEAGGLTVDYAYDSAGNRTTMVVTGDEEYTTTYTYDANNRLTQENKKVGSTTTTTLYSYDANGNLKQKSNPDGSEQCTYNGLNQLTHTRVGDTVAKYTYNADGIRISKQVGTSTTDYLLDGGDVVAEYTDGEMTAQFVRGVNLIRGILGPAARYFLHNAHGDVVALTTTTGTVRKRYDYDAFGNEKNPSSTDANPFRYCGEYFDKETKTYYLRARYYDPAIGRFTQQDTHWSPANAIYGDNPRKINEWQDALGLNTYAYAPEITAIMQSGNLYVYCVNNPVMYCDPTGDAIAKSYDSGDNDLAIMIVAVVAISAGVTIHRASQNYTKGSSGKIGGGVSAAGAPMPDPDDDGETEYEVSIPKSIANKIRKLAKEQQKSVSKVLEQLRLGDFRGLHNHPLSGNRAGQWAVDVRGSGKGRGAMRIIYEIRNGIITIIEIIDHHRY